MQELSKEARDKLEDMLTWTNSPAWASAITEVLAALDSAVAEATDEIASLRADARRLLAHVASGELDAAEARHCLDALDALDAKMQPSTESAKDVGTPVPIGACDTDSATATWLATLDHAVGRALAERTGDDGVQPKHPLERIKPKPRTTVKRFARDLKARIDRAAVAVDLPGQEGFASGMRYVLGIVDAALSDYDVRDPGDIPRSRDGKCAHGVDVRTCDKCESKCRAYLSCRCEAK